MFLKIEKRLFNTNNLLYFEYINNILTLTFSGEVTFNIQQQKDEFEDFNKFAKENLKLLFLKDNIAVSVNHISEIKEVNNNIFEFSFNDRSYKEFDNLNFEELQKIILEE